MQIYFCRTDANLASVREAATGNELLLMFWCVFFATRVREAATGNELPYYEPVFVNDRRSFRNDISLSGGGYF